MQVGSIILSHLYSKALACCCKNTRVKAPAPISITIVAAASDSSIIMVIIISGPPILLPLLEYIGLGNYDCFFFTKLFLNYLLSILLLL